MNFFRTPTALAALTTLVSTTKANAWSVNGPSRYARVMMVQPMASIFDGPCSTVSSRCREKGMNDPTTEFVKMMDQVFEKASSSTYPNTFREKMMNRRGGPMNKATVRYEVTDTDQEIKIAFDVPGMNANDIDILLENDGKILTIRGSRQSKSDEYSFSSNFVKSFYIDPLIDIELLKAQLENGVLIVSAPKDEKRLEDTTKKIPITVTTTSSSSMETPEEASNQDIDTSEIDNESENKIDIKVKKDE